MLACDTFAAGGNPRLQSTTSSQGWTTAAGILKKQQGTLEKFCYTDGTVFFLGRTKEENEQTQTAALGSRVWRQVDSSDGLWGDCVGPSAYSKAQGIPVKVWGMLAHGLLFIEILDQGVNMDIPTYTELIEDKFED